MAREISKNAKTRAFIPGDIVSVQAEDDKFAVMKILAMDETGLYGLLYARIWCS